MLDERNQEIRSFADKEKTSLDHYIIMFGNGYLHIHARSPKYGVYIYVRGKFAKLFTIRQIISRIFEHPLFDESLAIATHSSHTRHQSQASHHGQARLVHLLRSTRQIDSGTPKAGGAFSARLRSNQQYPGCH